MMSARAGWSVLGVLGTEQGVLRTGGPPVTSNHRLTDSTTTSSGNLSSGIIDLPGPSEQQDDERELDGALKNQTTGIRKIHDVKIWFEDLQGNKLKTLSGGAPVSQLRTGNGSSPPTHVATLAGTSGGVATFNLVEPISRGASVSYDAQVDHFVEPNNFRIKMSFSQKNASTGKHYEILGTADIDDTVQKVLIDGNAPTIRTGVLIGLKNVSGSGVLTGAVVTLVSNESGLKFEGGEVRDANDHIVPGAAVVVNQEGGGVTVSGLSLVNPDFVNIWLDINDTFTKNTSFKIVGLLQ